MYNLNMTLFDGKQEAKKLDVFIAEKVKESSSLGKLIIIQIGNNEVSEKYVELKLKVCSRLGISADYVFLHDSMKDEEIHASVEEIVNDESTQSAIIQLPLPRQSLKNILNIIPPDKDIDILSSTNQFRYYSNKLCWDPLVVRALNYFLETNDIDVRNREICIIGNGFLVGRPISHYVNLKKGIVTVIDNYVHGNFLNYQTIILSAGVCKLVNATDIVSGAVVIDFGSSMLNGKVTGDLDLKSNMSHLKIVSPSPGGMGPLVIRFLILNHLRIYDIDRSTIKDISANIYE